MTHRTYYDRYRARHRARYRARHRRPTRWTRVVCVTELLWVATWAALDTRAALLGRGAA